MTTKDLDYFATLSEEISALDACVYLLENNWKFCGLTDDIKRKLYVLQKEREAFYKEHAET